MKTFEKFENIEEILDKDWTDRTDEEKKLWGEYIESKEPQRRFDESIYKHLVSVNSYNSYKHCSKEEFEKTIEPLTKSSKIVEYDKNDIYRLADEKEICYDNRNREEIGVIYRENGLESYWIKQN